MAIISASRRTDIPAFFADWFMNRIREGHFYRINPFNAKQVKGFSLAPEDVDVIVFWSKNPRPLVKHLDELDRRGHRYYFQFTLNPYGPVFEPHLPGLAERLATFRELAVRIGAHRVVWRYDPVILSSETPVAWHLERLSAMAAELSGTTERLVFSFLDFYGKVNRRISELERSRGIRFYDLAAAEHREEMLSFAAGLKRIGENNGMEVLSCAEQEDFREAGIGHGSCIDGNLIRGLFGCDRVFARDKNQRKECLCARSVDMGMYNTCSIQCVYCYANLREKRMKANLAKHNPRSASIINDYAGPVEIIRERQG
jgi:DNA repair photolyase